MSYEEMAITFSHVPKDMLQKVLLRSLNDKAQGNPLLGGISSLLSPGLPSTMQYNLYLGIAWYEDFMKHV